MHPKTLLPVIIFICGLLVTTQKADAQQATEDKPVNLTPADMQAGITPPNYTFKIFQIPGNTPGYIILNNIKPVYLFRGLPITEAGKASATVIVKQPDLEKAAKRSIEKIKAGQNPVLTNDEITQLINNRPGAATN